MKRLVRRLMGGEQGYSLIELLVTMVILVIVLGSLTTIFVSGTSAEASLNRRFQAQQNARMGLDRIRTDIHCATAAQAQTINSFPGLKLAVGNCYAATPTVSWCAVLVTSVPPRYALYRSTTNDGTTCTSSDAARVLIADYLTVSSVFSTSAIPLYTLQRVGIDLRVSANAKTSTADAYDLADLIVARNSTRCTVANPAGGTTCRTDVAPYLVP
jgi:prepilin-type N-terminal cleavage/methylation domain-containing protein